MNILIIGFGSIGKRHYANCQKLGYQPEIYSQHQHKTKLKQRKYDFIIICSRTGDHLKDARRFKNFSQNFFIEKPLAKNTPEAQKIKTLLKNKRVMIGYTLIFHPLLKKIKQIITSNQLGDIFLAQIHAGYYLPYWRQTDYRQSYSASKKMGGGVSLDLIHEINYAQYLFPEPIKKMSAYYDHISDLKISSCDIAIFNLKQKDRCLNISLNYLNQNLKRYIRLFGTKKELYCDIANNSILITNNKNKKTSSKKIKLDINNLYLNELKLFINLIKTNKTTPKIFTLQQGIKDLKIANHVT